MAFSLISESASLCKIYAEIHIIQVIESPISSPLFLMSVSREAWKRDAKALARFLDLLNSKSPVKHTRQIGFTEQPGPNYWVNLMQML